MMDLSSAKSVAKYFFSFWFWNVWVELEMYVKILETKVFLGFFFVLIMTVWEEGHSLCAWTKCLFTPFDFHYILELGN
jgi:hypothetical protein